MTTPGDAKSGAKSGTKSGGDARTGSSPKPSEVAHERPGDDPGRGQGDVFDDKLPPESTTEHPSR